LRGARQALSAILLLAWSGTNPRAAHLEWRGGIQFDGRRESFGFASIFGSDEVVVQGDSLGARFRERRLEALAVAGLSLRPSTSAGADGLDLEARAGTTRRSFSLDGAIARSGLTVRNRVLADDEEQSDGSLRSAQNLLHLTWSSPADRTWRPTLRGAFDLSWADAGANDDSIAAVGARYLRYQRASLGVGLLHQNHRRETRFIVDLGRKWTGREARGAYESLAFEARRSALGPTGSLDLEVRAERRRYLDQPDDPAGGGLISYRELVADSRWLRGGAVWGLEASGRLFGTLYDGDAAVADTSETGVFAALAADRLELEMEWLVRRTFGGDPLRDTSEERRGLVTFEPAVGLAGEQLWVRDGAGEYHALGARLESTLRGGTGLGQAWLEIAAEAGRRDYRGDDGALNFDFEGLSLSLAQSDYAYLSGSLIGGGSLGRGFEWQLLASLDSEWHDRTADDALLFSLDLTLLRRWGSAR